MYTFGNKYIFAFFFFFLQVLELISYFENEIPEVSMFGFEFLSREFLVTVCNFFPKTNRFFVSF